MVALDTKAALPALADLKEVTLREATGALIMAEAATEAIAIKWGYVPKRKGLMKLERIKEWSCREQGSRLYALPVPYHGSLDSVHHAGHTPPRAQHALCRRALCRRTLSMHQHIGHKVSRFVPVFTVEHSKTYSLKGLSEIYEK